MNAALKSLQTIDAARTRYRRGRGDDAAVVGEILYQAFAHIAGRHGFAPDFPTPEAATGFASWLLNHPAQYSVIAEINGVVVGSNFLDERDAVAGVGPVTISPLAQNAGIGGRLMEEVLKRSRERGHPGIRLVQAAYHSRSLSLYTKLGFATREPLATLQGRCRDQAVAGCEVRTARQSDLSECNALCVRVHGHHRSGALLDAVNDGSARVVERNGRITGYAAGIGFLGHCVGETNDDIKALITSADGFGGPGILVPLRNAELFAWCLKQGLRVTQTMSLMTSGMYSEPQGAWLPSVLY